VKDENPEVIEATLDQLELFKRLKRKSELLERAIALKSADKPRPWHSQARPEQLQPDGDWNIWLYMAGRGCVAADTRIYMPDTDTHERIGDLARAGEPVTVLSLTPDGPARTRTAEAPFFKGFAVLFDVVCSDGNKITVTGQHKFLAPTGWLRLADLGVGDFIGAVDVDWVKVECISPAGRGAFYDMHVPGWNNYAAEGMWHHNSGKTASGSQWLAEQAVKNPGSEWAIVAPTWRDCRKVCIEGKSGLLKAFLPGELESMNASDLTVRLKNGSKIYGYSSDGYERLRGSNLSGAWVDEAAVMGSVEDMFAEALLPALRIGKKPRVLITTTPRPIKFLRDLMARDDGSVFVTRGSTWDNAANLSEVALAELRSRYEGTRIGLQELEGELLEDVQGALWNHDLLDETRVSKEDMPPLARVVVGVDPAVTSGEKSDYTGIVVAGRSHDGHLYILEDLTMKGTPHHCMAKAINAYHRWHADRIVGEVNNGGDYIESVLRSVDSNVAYKTVRATRGKIVRAEPISALWEQRRGHIVGYLPKLEDQMCVYTADTKESPDNLDSMVWCCTELNMGASAAIWLSAISDICDKCEYANRKGATVCVKCGESLI
jgi:phage terminase large subunit-like protein